MALTETTVADLTDLIRHVVSKPEGLRWFRGQGCHHRSLQSSLVRKLQPADGTALLSKEYRLITRFRQRSLPLWPEGYPQSDWEQLFAMQHHGIPTRLLDWSESLTVGAYFAADHDPARCDCNAHDCTPTVWILDPIAFNAGNPRLAGMAPGVLATSDEALNPWKPGTAEQVLAPDAVAIYGTHNSARIVAQQGTFTVEGKDTQSLETSPSVVHGAGVLEKVMIDCDRVVLKRELALLGVTFGRVYPGLPGVSRDIVAAELP